MARGEWQVACAVIAKAGERAGAADRGVPSDIQPLALPSDRLVPQAQGQHREVSFLFQCPTTSFTQFGCPRDPAPEAAWCSPKENYAGEQGRKSYACLAKEEKDSLLKSSKFSSLLQNLIKRWHYVRWSVHLQQPERCQSFRSHFTPAAGTSYQRDGLASPRSSLLMCTHGHTDRRTDARGCDAPGA